MTQDADGGTKRPVRVLFADITMGIGGAERIIQSIITGLHPEVAQPVIACMRSKGDVGLQLEQAGFRVYERLSRGKLDLRTVPALARVVRDERIDVVHTCNYPQVMGPMRLAMAIAGVRNLVVALHSIKYIGRTWWRNLALRVMGPFTARVVAISEGQKQHFMRVSGLRADAVEVIYNGIDIHRFAPGQYDRSARAEFDIPYDVPVVGILAALRPEKRHDVFLEAARRIRSAAPEAYFLIIGDGPERANIEAKARETGLAERVKLTGARSDVPRLLKAMDVSVLCSAFEALPVSILECMAMELPVVSTDVGSVNEIIVEGETGFLTLEGDPDALAARALEMLRSPGTATRMGRAGRMRVEEVFTRETMISRYESLFRRLAFGREGT